MANTQAEGKIVQCIGAVVDVEFPRNAMPKVYDALKLDGSALTAPAIIDMREAGFSIYGDGNVTTIAFGVTIEAAFGGSGADDITGNDVANLIDANGGNDTLAGGDGNDFMIGDDGEDIGAGGDADDVLFGGYGCFE